MKIKDKRLNRSYMSTSKDDEVQGDQTVSSIRSVC